MALMNQRRQPFADFDAEFFTDNDPLMIFIHAGSGSVRFDVEDIPIESGLCNASVRTAEPDATRDTAQWIICILLPKEVIAGITEYSSEILPCESETPNQ